MWTKVAKQFKMNQPYALHVVRVRLANDSGHVDVPYSEEGRRESWGGEVPGPSRGRRSWAK